MKAILAVIQVTPYYPIEDLYWTGLCSVLAKMELKRSET